MPLRRGKTIIAFAAAHFAASIVVFFAVIRDGSQRFHSGASASVWSGVISRVNDVLFFPLVTAAYHLPGSLFTGVAGWIPFLANSALWGVLLYLATRGITRRRGSLRAPGV